MIIYVWKILQGEVPNIGIELAHFNPRLGRMIEIKPYKGEKLSVKTLKENSFSIEGLKLFNSLPRRIRDYIGTKDGFKNILDKFLEYVLDNPAGFRGAVPQPVDNNCNMSNSIKHWCSLLKMNNWISNNNIQSLTECNDS